MVDYTWTEGFLFSQNMLSEIVLQILDKIDNFKTNYDKKVKDLKLIKKVDDC